MRVCSQCAAPDHELPSDGPEPEHFVKPEIRWVESAEKVTARLEKQGWKHRIFQGRHAMERWTCVNCLRANEDRDRMWSALRADAKRLEPGPAAAMDGYYLNLCEA